MTIADEMKAATGIDVPPFIVDWVDALVWLDLNVTMLCSRDAANRQTMRDIRTELQTTGDTEVWERVKKAWLTQQVGDQVQRLHDFMGQEVATHGQAD